jgi:predicted ester cyclase
LDAIKANISVYLAAFSNMALTIDEQVAEGDSVVPRVTASGTFTGPLGDVQPTGKDLSLTITALMHIRDGRIVEEWELYDRLGMLQQIGVMPVEAPA